MDISAIAGTVSALKGAMDISKAMIDLRDGQAIQAKVIELNSKILEAQSSAFVANDERTTLIQRVSHLEKEVADLEAWGTEKNDYQLKTIDRTAFVFAIKPSVQRAEPPHWLCANCYQHRKKSILQGFGRIGPDQIYKCHGCDGVIRVNWGISPDNPS